MANSITKVEIGAFAAGEIPPPFQHTFTDLDGGPLDVSAFSVQRMNIESVPAATSTLGAGVITMPGTGADGVVQYAWSADDMAVPGDYEAQLWVYEPGTPYRFASDLITYMVYDGPGEAPT